MVSQGEASAKKGPFDGLDRDELIAKLKGLLSVLKNAKHSKEGKWGHYCDVTIYKSNYCEILFYLVFILISIQI